MQLFAPKQTILNEALPFQGDLVQLLEEPLPRGIRSTIYYCVFLAAVALGVAIFVKVDVVVQGPGKLTYDGQPIVLQAFERAVLRSLDVKPGDTVKKGQVLARLDPTFAQADLAALEDRSKTLRAQLKRMQAETAGIEFNPESDLGATGALQAEIFAQRNAEYRFRLKSFTESIQESEAAIQRIQTERNNLEEQLGIASSIEQIQSSLLKTKTNSQLEFLESKTSRLRSEREYRDATDRLVEKRHQLEAAQAQKESFVQEWRRTLLEEQTKLHAEFAQVEASLTKSSKINSMVVISAPADAVVLDIANRSVGSVLRDTEPLVVLVPTDAPLLAEIGIGSSDIGQVAVGDSVLMKVDAFPYQRHGGLSGRVRSISHESHAFGGNAVDLESVANKRAAQGGFHRVTVELLTTRMERLPADRTLFPGMTATGEVHVGRRRLINYLLDPLLRGMRESFRET